MKKLILLAMITGLLTISCGEKAVVPPTNEVKAIKDGLQNELMAARYGVGVSSVNVLDRPGRRGLSARE